MSTDTALSASVLGSLADGVLTLGRDGRILTFNPAAEKILGVSSESATGAAFADLFMNDPSSEAFAEAVLAAIYEPDVTHRTVVPYASGGRELRLAMRTARLRGGADAVVVVFSDVTEVSRLSDELKTKHAELQKAFLEIEEGNRELAAAAKRMQVVRAVATGLVILFVTGAAWLAFARGRSGLRAGAPPGASQPGAPGRRAAVKPQRLVDTVSLVGTLRPLEVVHVTSPLGGKVAERLVQYGQSVTKGQPLVQMDTSEVAQRLREATSAAVKADETFRSLSAWSKSPDVSRARRSYIRAKMALEAQQQAETEADALFAKGIVPRSERDSARKQRVGAEMDLQAAEEELATVLEKGNPRALELARAELEGAERRRKDLAAQVEAAVVVSPVSGTVLVTESARSEGNPKLVEKGVAFGEGEALLAVGDMQGVSAAVDVDELEVLKMREGQAASISGDAFPGLVLAGKVASVSGRAATKRDTGGRGGRPGFEVIVAVERLAPDEREKVRLGMSTRIEIVVSDRKDVLVVPFAAVELRGADRYVTVADRTTGTLRSVKVETGLTSVDGVEVLKGLSAGDEVAW